MDVHQTGKHFKAIILISHNNAEKVKKQTIEKVRNMVTYTKKKWEIHIAIWSNSLNPDALSQ